MTYKYLYQTKENENREGEISAKNREAAYRELRKQGIRPYRLIGDDPVNWIPWAVGAGVALVIGALVAVIVFRSGDGAGDRSPRLRQQIVGDAALIAAGVADDWSGQLSTRLDRYLAAYVQPGDGAVPPYVETNEVESLRADLEKPIVYVDGERSEYRQLKNIVAYLREEMDGALKSGKTVAEYFEFLEQRQREEISLRHRAEESVMKAPESYRDKMVSSVNAQLRSRGIAPVKLPAEER